MDEGNYSQWRRQYKKRYNKEYYNKTKQTRDPVKIRRASIEWYYRMKANITPEKLIGRWRIAAKGLLSDSEMPTKADLTIIGLLAYAMNITPTELMKFLAGLTPTIRSLKQIKQWLDFREQIVLEEELPEEIRERHRIVNANYTRITEELDALKEKDGSNNA
jgi:hypothetical protein